jgi:hypothetical protein
MYDVEPENKVNREISTSEAVNPNSNKKDER